VLNGTLIYLAVILSVTHGRGRMHKVVIPSPTWSMDSETDGHGGVVTVALHCGELELDNTLV